MNYWFDAAQKSNDIDSLLQGIPDSLCNPDLLRTQFRAKTLFCKTHVCLLHAQSPKVKSKFVPWLDPAGSFQSLCRS